MGTYRSKPVEIEAVQFTGDNWAEMHEFTGHRMTSDGHPTDVFNPIGTYVVPRPDQPHLVAELWCANSATHVLMGAGGWVIRERDFEGFYPCTAEVFEERYEPKEINIDMSGVEDFFDQLAKVAEARTRLFLENLLR